jgi:hypothetical protein
MEEVIIRVNLTLTFDPTVVSEKELKDRLDDILVEHFRRLR